MPGSVRTSASIACVVISIVATATLSACSIFEHYRNPRPSSIIEIYLLLSLVFDIARVRTLFATEDARSLAWIALASLPIKFVLLILELKEKTSLLLENCERPAPEYVANFFNRLVFWWINPLLLSGYSRPLQEAGLFNVDPYVGDERELQKLADIWESCRLQILRIRHVSGY